MARKLKYSTESIIAKCVERHGDLYVYEQLIYTGIQNKCTIICKQHGPFNQIIADHINGAGCPSCGGTRSNNTRISKETENQKTARYRKIHETRRNKDNYKSASLKGYITLSTKVLDNGKTALETRIEKMKHTRIKRGSYCDPNLRSAFQKYKSSVYHYTRKYRKLFKHQYPVEGMHLDHKFSIFEGFKFNVPPNIIGHFCNLEYIPEYINRSKHTSCSISIEHLIQLINEFEESQTY